MLQWITSSFLNPFLVEIGIANCTWFFVCMDVDCTQEQYHLPPSCLQIFQRNITRLKTVCSKTNKRLCIFTPVGREVTPQLCVIRYFNIYHSLLTVQPDISKHLKGLRYSQFGLKGTVTLNKEHFEAGGCMTEISNAKPLFLYLAFDKS